MVFRSPDDSGFSESELRRILGKSEPEQPTIPPMPPVTPLQQEEINHPSRYAGGKYECIDVMQDVFGVEAVKHFCMLNAFKYLWRAEKKNGIEDIKKAVWYLNKYIELDGDDT